MRNVYLVSSLLMALSVSMFGMGCGGSATTGANSKASNSGPERTLALRWLPAETEALLHLKVADLWQAPLLKGFVDSPQASEFVAELKKTTGLTPADIESVTLGAADLAGMKASIMGHAIGMPGPNPKGMVVVIRTKKSVSLEELVKSKDLKSATHKSKKYFESSDGEFGVWVAEPTTVVWASPADLKATMERGETVTPRKELAFADSTSHVILLVAPKDTKALGQAIDSPPPPDAPAEVLAAQQTLVDSLPGVAIGINIRGGIDLQTTLLLSNSEGAGKVKGGLDAAIQHVKGEFEDFKLNLPPLLSELAEQLVNNVKVESKTQVVTVSTSIPDSDQKKIEELPSLLTALTGFSPFGTIDEVTGPAIPKTGKKLTGRRSKASGDGSTTGGGVEVPADPAGGTLEKPDEKKTEDKPEETSEEKKPE